MGHSFLWALPLFATSVWADLVKVAEAEGITYYLDPLSISVADGFRRVSVIQNYARQERSRSVVYDIDCHEHRLRFIAVTEYSDPMARGQTVDSWQTESGWIDVAFKNGQQHRRPEPYRAIVQFVCTR